MEKVIDNGLDRLLYFDTDSIIYIKKENDKEIDCGDCLGDMTDEIISTYGEKSK